MANDHLGSKALSPAATAAEGEISQDLRITTSMEGQKSHLAGHKDYHGIDTTQVQPGADAAYEAKITILNEALIDIGMGPFQWKIFATTGFGWFIDNVC